MNKHPLAIKSAFLACLLNALLLSPLGAADAPPVTFRGLATEGQVEGIYFDDRSGKPEEFRAIDSIRSKFYRARGGQSLAFYKLLPPLEEGGEPVREVVGSVEWPLGGGPYLVLVSKSADGYGFAAMRDDDSTFPMGSFRFLNGTKYQLEIHAGGDVLRLSPDEETFIKPPLPEEGHGVLFQIYMLSGGKKLILYSNVWPVKTDMRSIVFIFEQNNKNYPVVVKRIHEHQIQLQRQREREALEAMEAKKQ